MFYTPPTAIWIELENARQVIHFRLPTWCLQNAWIRFPISPSHMAYGQECWKLQSKVRHLEDIRSEKTDLVQNPASRRKSRATFC